MLPHANSTPSSTAYQDGDEPLGAVHPPPPRGGIVAEWTYLEVFHAARQAALTEAEAATPLMGRPYDLRHAAVSTWLNAGVPAPQVAEWAGHSVNVLLRVYAKCIAGQQTEAKRRIEEATRPRKTTQPGCGVDDENQDA